jgi:predicted CoA-substrate-specific enzyme activase
MYFLGVDIGAITAKAVLIAEQSGDGADRPAIFDTFLMTAGYNREETATTLKESILEKAQVSEQDIQSVCATGYGRKAVPFADLSVTEITCHAKGALYLRPETDYVIDIGGQDAKGIRVDAAGKVVDFIMNDKCAAGTGRFLEVMAHAMETDLDQFDRLSAEAETAAAISSTCTVFAETEVVSHLAAGVSRESIIAGIHDSIAERIAAMTASIQMGDSITMTGGVSRNGGVVRALETKLGRNIHVPELGQLAGALGAAVIAWEKHPA